MITFSSYFFLSPTSLCLTIYIYIYVIIHIGLRNNVLNITYLHFLNNVLTASISLSISLSLNHIYIYIYTFFKRSQKMFLKLIARKN